jgi:CheY-like chemotaxis protein/tetratricopeptide (TPR) repeat protein
MELASQLTALREETRGLTPVERARRCCDLAKKLEKAGEYEVACEALNEFWTDQGAPPNLSGLDETTRAEVLLRVGGLAGWLGSTDQTEGSQETAKNLITQSIDLFQRLGLSGRVAEARGDLALCYCREGSYDEARITLVEALDSLGEKDSYLKALLLIRAGIIEARTQQLHEAVRFYNEAAPLLDRSEDHALKGAFHNGYGLVFSQLAVPENREDYLDRALMEYTAASFHFELAGNTRFLARVENNLGHLFFTIGKFDEAHRHLDRARHLFFAQNDVGAVAQVDDTRARTLLAENRLAEAERVARYAVHTLEKGDEHAVLAGALTTHGVAFARLGDYPSARRLLQQAIEVAETTGDLEGAGRAKLSIIEELSGQTPAPQLVSIYQSAAELLKRSQDPSTSKRLIACAQRVIEGLRTAEFQGYEAQDLSWAAFKREIRKAEKALLARALQEAEGSVTKAARLLGFKHHQSLISIINVRHKDLLKTRSRIRKRRRHIFSQPRRTRRTPPKLSPVRRTSQISMLHVADKAQAANLVAEMFAGENWRLELCNDGDSALRRLTSEEHYDLLVVDNDLPELNGLELIRRARRITRCRRTPIIMLSASDCEREAWRAGVNAFLRKPEQIDELPTTVARLLTDRSNDG